MENPQTPIAIVGAGRLGPALARLLVEAGEPVVAIASRTLAHAREAAAFAGPGVRPARVEELPRLANRILLAVSDSAIAAVAAQLAREGFPQGLALHCCGSIGPEPLAPLAERGVACGVLHPLQTVPSPEAGVEGLRGICWSITGEGEAAAWGREIAARLGGRVIEIAPEHRALYHAAAVMACNYFVAVEDAAVAMLEHAGVARQDALAALQPIVGQTYRNVFGSGPEKVLTGPITRGEAETVARHLQAVRALPENIRELFRTAGLYTVSLARRRGLEPAAAARMERLLRDNGGEDA